MDNVINYVNLTDTTSQYDDLYYKTGNPIAARYVKATLEIDRGNIFIEALPRPRNEHEIQIVYNNEIPSYSFSNVKNMTTFEKMLAVGLLKNLRFNLPFHSQLEFQLYNALLISYWSRKLIISDKGTIQNTIQNEPTKNNGILVGDSGSATNAGFSLIGYSGCGKSSAIEVLVSHYPQVIMHRFSEYEYFPQIIYIVVNCIPNSNFGALYEGIGDAIDKALGNIEPVYSTEINKCRNLGSKAEKVRSLIEKFAIGAIIFDEIQLIDFEHTKENTFDSLLTLANKTKTAIIVVGTEDAKDKMFSELRTSRRLGMMINGNAYCDNRRFFDILVNNLFYYQWFDVPVECTQDIRDTLYDLTKGIIDQLISLYSAVHIEYLSTGRRPTVDGAYFSKIAKKYYPGIQDVLANLENVDNVRRLNEIRQKADNMIEQMMDAAKQNEKAEQIIQSAQQTVNKSLCLHNITTNIKRIYDYSDEQIQNAFKKVISRKNNEEMDERQITRLTIEQLEKKPSRKKAGKRTEVIDNYKSFLGVD